MSETLPDLPMFCSVEWADAFFASFLWNTNWTGATQEQKEAALKTATNLIQRYAIFYDDEGEVFVFDPSENEMPDLLKEATAKEAVMVRSVSGMVKEYWLSLLSSLHTSSPVSV